MRAARLMFLFILLAAVLAIPSAARAQIGVSITIAPPILPVYEQPLCPEAGYIWTPGYWAYGDDGYYWVPGTWVAAPEVGLLWTPGYWGWNDGLYVGTKDIGARTSVFMAASCTASDMTGWDSKAATGRAEIISTTLK